METERLIDEKNEALNTRGGDDDGAAGSDIPKKQRMVAGMPRQLEEPAPRPRLCDPAGVSCRRMRKNNSGVRPLLVPALGRHLGARGLAHLPVSQLEVVRG